MNNDLGNAPHPIATLCMANGARVVLRLLPEHAPNTVASFVYAAAHGWLDHHAVERIVPGDWVDVSYTAFGREECKYLIPNEFTLHPELSPLPSHPGCVCMGGYDNGLAGCEFFFPLRDCPEHRGVYPVFGTVEEGWEEILRLERVETEPVTDFPIPGVKINRPLAPQIIERVELRLFGRAFPEPVRVRGAELPPNWR